MIDKTAQSLTWRLLYWAAAIGLVALGIYLSDIRFLGAEWLSRAGCLVVVLGIWSSVGSIIQERLLASRMRWRRRNVLASTRARQLAEDTDPVQAQKELDEIEQGFDKSLADATHSLRMTLGALEVSLLICGTLLWGFGDLLAALL